MKHEDSELLSSSIFIDCFSGKAEKHMSKTFSAPCNLFLLDLLDWHWMSMQFYGRWVKYSKTTGTMYNSVAIRITERVLKRTKIRSISNLIGRRYELTAIVTLIYSDRFTKLHTIERKKSLFDWDHYTKKIQNT